MTDLDFRDIQAGKRAIRDLLKMASKDVQSYLSDALLEQLAKAVIRYVDEARAKRT